LIWKPLAEMASSARVKKLGSGLAVVWTTALCAAVAGMFFTERYPAMKPVVWWTLVITFGAPLIAGAIAIACITIVWPGVEMSKILFQDIGIREDPKWARRLTIAWSCGAGLLLSLVLGTAFALIAFGVAVEIKLWFIAVCWLVLMVPWVLAGLLGRWLFRRSAPIVKLTSETEPAKEGTPSQTGEKVSHLARKSM
jgi:hypothetical protein